MKIADLNILYEAYRSSMKGSSWKREPQKFEHNWLEEISSIKKDLESETYHTSHGTEFKLCERGKTRHIHGARMRDRVVRHALCDFVLNPSLKPYLINNNGASQKGKGLSFARKQFEKDLHNYYLKHKTNKGFVGFVDISKFYDNIQHQKIKEFTYPLIPKDTHWLMDEIIRNFEIDVSYMNDEEYSRCLYEKFNSVEYYETIPKLSRTGKKFMKKSVNIGDQVSQDIGVFFPFRIDNYAKIIRRCKFYGRYMDDIYFICQTKQEAYSIIEGITKTAKDIGLFINEHKTRVVPLDSTYKYLQVKYSLNENGKVIKRLNPKSITRERRKLKAYKRLLDRNEIVYADIEQAYKSWMGCYYKLMSKKQIKNLKTLYKELFGKEPKWKKPK